jgi:hypothetical protein
MGTAALRSILESMVDQIIKVTKTEKSPSHKKGEEETLRINPKTSKNLLTLKALFSRTPFFKQKWVKVSSISENTNSSNIATVTFFLDMGF